MRGEALRVFSHDRLEDVRWMTETGESFTGAARRLGISEKTLERWCEKHCPELLAVLRRRDPKDANYRTRMHQWSA